MILMKWVATCGSRDNLMITVDSKLEGNFKAEEVKMLLKLGMLCSQSNPENRPSMRHIVQYLEGNVPVPSISFDTTGFGMPNISNETHTDMSGLKPSVVSGFEHHMALIIESEISFAKLRRRYVTAWDHIFSDHIFSNNIFSNCLKMDLPEFPPRMFTLGEESAAIRSISYHSDDTKLFKTLCDCLTADKGVEIGSVHQVQGAWLWLDFKAGTFYSLFPAGHQEDDQQEPPMYALSQSSDPPARLGDNSLPIEVDDDEDEEDVMNQELDEHLFNSTESF
ncbi:hypothetical protein F2Q69_00019319 [Brassica cretica]|uniref:Legume lectin domain-containing protein n=1 Tax=Brassica cretica TaxID=69181 RepID=A0A8S9QH60_BRACR|nr:hypothetical protein F2Q69_00019319 [Brassica cretica]